MYSKDPDYGYLPGPGIARITDVVQDILRDPDPAKDIASIAVTPATPSISHLSGTQQMVATATMRDGTTRVITTAAGIVWASSDPTKATISAGGLVTGVAAGSTTISASLGGVAGSTTATIT